MIEYKCPVCGAAMTSPISLAGKEDFCPRCGEAAIVPESTGETPCPINDMGEKPRPQPGNVWKIALASICIVIFGYGFLNLYSTHNDLGSLIGSSLVLAWIMRGIFSKVVPRQRETKIKGLSFLAMFICLIASGWIGSFLQKREARQLISEIQNQYSAMVESSTDSQGLPKPIDTQADTAPKTHGESGEVERFIKELMVQMASQRNDYLLELETIGGFNGILNANRIKEDKTLSDSKAKIQQIKEIVKKHRKRINMLVSRARRKIRSLNISESLKREAFLSFDRGVEKGRNHIDAIWSLEDKLINELENIIELLSTRKGAWVVEGDRILFYNENDLAKFNSYIAALQSLMNQEKDIQRQGAQAVNQYWDRLRKDMK